MKLAPPAEEYYEYTSLNLLIKSINEQFKMKDTPSREKESIIVRTREARSIKHEPEKRHRDSLLRSKDVSKRLKDLHVASCLSLS